MRICCCLPVGLCGYVTPVAFTDPLGLWRHTKQGWVAEKGDTLWDLSERLYGDGTRWTEFKFEGDPESLHVDHVITVDATTVYYYYGDDQADHAAINIQALRDDGYAVVGAHFNTESAFTDAWNAMPDSVDTIIINQHGSPTSIRHVNMDDLDPKTIDTLVLLTCNGGHLDVDDNPERTFYAQHNINRLVSADGFSMRYEDGSIRSANSSRSETFNLSASQENGVRRSPKGFTLRSSSDARKIIGTQKFSSVSALLKHIQQM